LGNNNFSKNSLPLTQFADNKAIKAENNKWTAFALNLLLGAGIGSFVQGDTTGGVVELCGELGGLTLLIIGITPNEVYYPGYYYGYYITEYPNIGFAYVGFIIGHANYLCK
jgi:hypothetical protein